MRVLVIGAGLVGTLAGERLRGLGHHVTVTTTTPAKADDLRSRFDDVAVLRGTDRAVVAERVAAADAVLVTAGPSAAHAMSAEERASSYHDVLVETALSVTSAPGAAHLVAMSAISVYGTAADHLPEVTEDSPVTSSADPSPVKFLEMEGVYLASDRASDRSCVFRCGDIYGAGDPPITAKVAMAHQHLGGSVPFAADALLYRLHVDDAVGALVHALSTRLTGLYNLTHPELPPTNAALFDALSAEAGQPPLDYRDEIAAPTVPVSVRKLTAAGFTASRSFDWAPTAPTVTTAG